MRQEHAADMPKVFSDVLVGWPAPRQHHPDPPNERRSPGLQCRDQVPDPLNGSAFAP
jgi:hypothetical protein